MKKFFTLLAAAVLTCSAAWAETAEIFSFAFSSENYNTAGTYDATGGSAVLGVGGKGTTLGEYYGVKLDGNHSSSNNKCVTVMLAEGQALETGDVVKISGWASGGTPSGSDFGFDVYTTSTTLVTTCYIPQGQKNVMSELSFVVDSKLAGESSFVIARAGGKSTNIYSVVIEREVEDSGIPALATPVISNDGKTVTIEGTNVYYTIDGTEPSAESTPYTEPFDVAHGTEVKAIAIAEDEDHTDSKVASKIIEYLDKLAAPVISQVAPGVAAIANVDGATKICYTTDGTAPTAESTEYTGEFEVADGTLVKAIAVGDNETAIDSPVAAFFIFVPVYEAYANSYAVDKTAPEAGTTIIDDEVLTVSTVYTTNTGDANCTYANEKEFPYFMQVRVKALPSSSNKYGTDNGGSTPLVFVANDYAKVRVYYRRQIQNNTYSNNDGKDISFFAPGSSTRLESTLIMDHALNAEYAYAAREITLAPGETVVLAATGTTGQVFGIDYEAIPSKTFAEAIEETEGTSFILKNDAVVVHVDDMLMILHDGTIFAPAYGSEVNVGDIVKAGWTATVSNGALCTEAWESTEGGEVVAPVEHSNVMTSASHWNYITLKEVDIDVDEDMMIIDDNMFFFEDPTGNITESGKYDISGIWLDLTRMGSNIFVESAKELMYRLFHVTYAAAKTEPSSIVAIEAADADAIYYNLQGVRVDNPIKGNVYIRVAGEKASKVIVK